MRKAERQQYLRQLMNQHSIERQEDFVSLLDGQGIKVTQATISRDIKEMQLVKVPSIGGGYHYSLPVQKQLDTQKKLRRTLGDAVISMDIQDKLVVLHVQPGNGPALSTLISQMNYEDVFCTLGDDSTVLLICRSDSGAQQMLNLINELIEG
ncbi:arginine catabolic regulator [Paucilactobacillus vaccinostercus DSM 20634]|jgi:transcriptional regulator of arginine metabolism|uniref:Arginine repressor n=1 Tax=Paucilactobacillus vaccinostercus DSM 20634 TaxID=1423813 RepID=A0A0R2A6E8_9LACO|nr:ArgR family transcriptional regulator [Paucilactobacillus vaccinostercus]KRM62637.1 arginine catabolic regulator [Paucilactobacillus vaccinostercus DSM 20634]